MGQTVSPQRPLVAVSSTVSLQCSWGPDGVSEQNYVFLLGVYSGLKEHMKHSRNVRDAVKRTFSKHSVKNDKT